MKKQKKILAQRHEESKLASGKSNEELKEGIISLYRNNKEHYKKDDELNSHQLVVKYYTVVKQLKQYGFSEKLVDESYFVKFPEIRLMEESEEDVETLVKVMTRESLAHWYYLLYDLDFKCKAISIFINDNRYKLLNPEEYKEGQKFKNAHLVRVVATKTRKSTYNMNGGDY